MNISMDEQFAKLIKAGEAKLHEIDTLKIQHQNSLEELKRDHRGDLEELKRDQQMAMDRTLDDLTRKSKSEFEVMKTRVTQMAVGFAAVVIFGLLTFLYNGTKDAYSGMKEVNQSVISLQDKFLSAQETISNIKERFDAATNDAEIKIRKSIKSAEDAQTNLDVTTTKYELRLKELQRPVVQSNQ